MKIKHPNRANKRKQKKGCGCKMCKPHKGKWQSFFKEKYRQIMKLKFDAL